MLENVVYQFKSIVPSMRGCSTCKVRPCSDIKVFFILEGPLSLGHHMNGMWQLVKDIQGGIQITFVNVQSLSIHCMRYIGQEGS